MKTERDYALRSSFRYQKLRHRAFKYKFILLLALLFLGPIIGTEGQETKHKNISERLNVVSLTQQNAIQSVPLWGGTANLPGKNITHEQETIKLHHFDLPCENCHNSNFLISTEKTQSENHTYKGIDINRMCTSLGCHNYDTILNHPVNVRVNGKIPEDMPLENSHITCLTCHNQKKSSNPMVVIEETMEHRLRIPNKADLCGSCHKRMPGNLKEQSHWQFSSRAHLGQINQHSNRSISHVQNIGDIDTESRICISCHQDKTVSIPDENETITQKRKRWQYMKDHPIGMEYAHVVFRKSSRYRYPLSQNIPIRFFNGKMGCGSCHSLYSDQKWQLVRSHVGSELCFECHDLR